MIVGLGVTSCVVFERECGQMWLNPKGVVWWGVIVVPTSWRPEQPWCPLEGDTCPSNQQPAAHQYNSLRWHRVFVNETWTLSCSIWWRHRTQSSLFVSMASNLMGRQRQNRCRTKQMDFGCKLFNQGRETKFWEAGELMRFSILGKQEEIFTLHTIFHHAIPKNSSRTDLTLGSSIEFYQLTFNRYEVQGLKLLAEAWENLE